MDIREAMEKAAEQIESNAEPEVTPEVVEAAPAVEAAPEPQADTRTAAERARDEKGRFAPKAEKSIEKSAAAPKGDANGAASAPADQGKGAGTEPPTVPVPAPVSGQLAGTDKAPVSWKPLAREKWAALPAEVREEWSRREKEMSGFIARSGEHAKVAEQVQRVVAPYEAIARANGMDSMQYAGSVLQTAAVLHVGSPQQKAALVAQLIGSFGIDVDHVNAAMQGGPAARAAPQPPQDVSRLVQEELARQTQAASEAKAAQAWEEFQASEPEFLEQVKPAMREILHLAGQQGRKMTYEQAYDRACKLDEEVSAELARRKAAEAVRTPQPVTERTRAAASSVRSQPAAPPSAQPKGIRGAMEAAAEKLGM